MKILIKNGTLISPGSSVLSHNDLALIDGHIAGTVQCADTEESCWDEVIDASDKFVCPGFIDIHMHEEPLEGDTLASTITESMLLMGVTTAIGGNCGSNTMNPSQYLDMMDKNGGCVNIGLLAGHTYAREKAGFTNKYAHATAEQIKSTADILSEYLSAGCLGISYGIRYVPGIDARELTATASLCCRMGGFISGHIRDDAAYVFTSVRELADTAVSLGLPVEISHIGSMGGFGQMEDMLNLMDSYRINGLELGCDCYPYYAFSTQIGETTYDDGFLERYDTDYSAIEICTGKYKGLRCTEEIFRELRRDSPDTITVCHVMKHEDVDMALMHPYVSVASDGLRDGDQGHPRAAGTFPKFIRDYITTGKISAADGIAKMTSLPAKMLGLKNKGVLKVGADADITIFDPKTIQDRATFASPALPPSGIDCVIINGQIALRQGRIEKRNLGRSIRKRR